MRNFWSRLMALIGRNFSWLPNPDGTVDGHYPNGDKPPGAASVAWGNLSALIAAVAQRSTGSSFSHDIRQYLSGTGAATATLSLVTVSGDDAASEGWAYSGDNLTHPGSQTGAGFFKLGATVSGDTVYSAAISWSWITAPVGDVLAPTPPTEFALTAIPGGFTVAHNPATDPHDGTQAGSGIAGYKVRRGATLVATQTSGVSPGFTDALTTYTIGSPSPGFTITQSGRNWQFAGEGNYPNTAADRGAIKGRTISGDFVATCKVPAYNYATSAFAKVGLQMRASTAVGAIYITIHQRPADGNQGIRVQSRTQTDAAAVTDATITGITSDVYLHAKRVGDAFTVGYSLDGGVPTVVASKTLLPGSSVIVGGYSSSQTSSTSLTATINDLNIRSGNALSYDITTATAGAHTVEAYDTQGNTSAVSASVTGTPGVAAPPVKWDPGYYVFESNFGTYNSTRLTEILGMANCQGYKIRINWKDIETSRGVYNFTFLDGLLALCEAAGKHLIIQVFGNSFNSTNPVPTYMASEAGAGGGWYQKASPLVGYQAKIYLPAVMDRILALGQAMATQYDAHAKVAAMILLGESSLPQVTSQSDYTESGYLAQRLRYISTLPTYFTRTPVFIGANFGYQTITNWGIEFAALAAGKCGYNGPDIYTSNSDNSTSADRYARGLIYNGSDYVAGGTDYRGVIPISHDAQSPELGGKENTGSGQTLQGPLYTQSSTINKDNFVAFLYKDFTTTPTPPNDIYFDHTQGYAASPVASSQDIKTFITGGASPVVTAAPSVYSSVVTDDDPYGFRAPLSTDKYVDAAAANDSGSGTQASPWKTITAARYQTLTAGQALWLRTGTYAWPDVTSANNGTSANRITVSGYPSESAVVTFTDAEQRVGNADYHEWRNLDIQCQNHGIMLANGFFASGSGVSRYFRMVDCTGTRNSGSVTDNSGIVEAYGDSSATCGTPANPIQIIRCRFQGPSGLTQNQTLCLFDYVEGLEVIGCDFFQCAIPIYFKHTTQSTQARQYALIKNNIFRSAGRGFQAAMNWVQYLNNAWFNTNLGMDESGGGIAGGNNCILSHNTFYQSSVGCSITDSGTRTHLNNTLTNNVWIGASNLATFEDNPFSANSSQDQNNSCDYSAGDTNNHFYRNGTRRTITAYHTAFATQEVNGVQGSCALVGGASPGATPANWALAPGSVGLGNASDSTDRGCDASKLLTVL